MGKQPGKLWGNIWYIKPNKTILNHFRFPRANPSKPPFYQHRRHFTAVPSLFLGDSVGTRTDNCKQ